MTVIFSSADIASIAHQANHRLRSILGEEPNPKWEDVDPVTKVNLAKAVHHQLIDPASSGEKAHERWLNEKVLDGWVYGPQKDLEKKTHPCCVPYEQLPPEQRIKDALFTTVVNALKPLALYDNPEGVTQ